MAHKGWAEGWRSDQAGKELRALKYETINSIKGWVALLVLGIGFLCCISALAPDQTLEDRATAGLIFFVGVILGISWIRGRKRIRKMHQQIRMLRKVLRGVRQRSQADTALGTPSTCAKAARQGR